MLQQYIKAVESSNIVSRTDINGIITFANDEFCKISGYSRDELIGCDHNIVRHPDVPSKTFKKLWDTILEKQTYKATVKNLAKDGSTFYVNTTIVPILDEKGNILEFVAIRYDVTREMELQLRLEQKDRELETLNRGLEERVRVQTRELQELNRSLEQRVREEIKKNEEKQQMLLWQSRFASLGQMVANIAHQWRQPLTELNLAIYNLKNSINCDVPNEKTENIYKQTKKIILSMSQTIDNFMDFFKPNKECRQFDVKQSLEEALALIQQALDKEQISVSIDINRDIYIVGIPNELTQVFINILQNSKDAFIDGKKENRKIRIHIDMVESDIVISIEDNAGGMDKEIIQRIFEPYFTTKHKSQGTGLGLFMSRMIIQKSFGGTIEALNSLDGALFIIKIPTKKDER